MGSRSNLLKQIKAIKLKILEKARLKREKMADEKINESDVGERHTKYRVAQNKLQIFISI